MGFVDVMQIRFLARSVRKHRNLRLLAVETALLPIDDLKGQLSQSSLPAQSALTVAMGCGSGLTPILPFVVCRFDRRNVTELPRPAGALVPSCSRGLQDAADAHDSFMPSH